MIILYPSINEIKSRCVNWIKEWFKNNGSGCNAVIGISGGKDSSVVAALCVEALGKNRVIGVLMPNGVQSDKQDAIDICDFLGIKRLEVNIKEAFDDIISAMPIEPSTQTVTNLPARIRMATLYAVSQSVNGRVVNTCNLSEDYVGYSTRYGDSAGDFAPLANLTTDEVIAIGEACGLLSKFVNKVPSDGLCGKTDEDNLGFTYSVLNKYIREGVCADEDVKRRIDEMHKKNRFKLELMPSFNIPELTIYEEGS